MWATVSALPSGRVRRHADPRGHTLKEPEPSLLSPLLPLTRCMLDRVSWVS